jgi:uncharacterized cupredoxin-like copper-binding protein
MVNSLTPAVPAVRALTWPRLLYLAAGLEVAVLAVMIVVQRDLLALALAGLILVGLGLWLGRARLGATRLPLRRWLAAGWPGLLVLGLVFTDIAAYTATGALSNLLSHAGLFALALPAALAVLSLTGLAAAVAVWRSRAAPGAGWRMAPWVAGVALVAFASLIVAGLLGGQRVVAAPLPSTILLNTSNMKFSDTHLEAAAGMVTLRLSNSDLFWHTFNVDALGVSVQAPVGGEREITFTAAPGVYEFYCAIPGHALIGMQGTLVVK